MIRFAHLIKVIVFMERESTIMASQQEIDRRYALLREAMRANQYRVLVVAGNSEGNQRGYIRYLADWRLFGGTGYLVFSLDRDPIFVLGMGAQAEWARELSAVPDTRAVLNKIEAVSQVLHALGLARERVGIVGMNTIVPYGDMHALMTALPHAHFADATGLLESLMVVLSPEEKEMAAQTHALVVQVFDAFKDALAPGRTEREVAAAAYQSAAALGCVDGMVHLSHAAGSGTRPALDRPIDEMDSIKVFIEFAGPTGYLIELGGVFSFHAPPAEKLRKHETVVKATERAIAATRPGMTAGELTALIRQTYVDDGWEIVGRRLWDFHGQGLHSLLPPYGLPGSKEVFAENMMINIHPGILTADGWGVSTTSNYFVTPNGGRPLGDFKHQWHVLDVRNTRADTI
jgi:Xaa-Pro aminopeptidase